MQGHQPQVHFVICIDNTEYPAALERRKIYEVIPDALAAQHRLLRVIDESGEDYLYPQAYFIAVDFAPGVQAALIQAACVSS